MLGPGTPLLWCAISLALACGERSSPPEPRRFEARLELQTAVDAKPQGVVCADLDGDGRDEVIAATIAPPTLQIFSKVSRELGAPLAPRAMPIDDFSLGPIWVDRERAHLAVASRATPNVVVLDARKSFASGAPEVVWRIDLEARPRVLAAGLVGTEPVVAVITINDDLCIARASGRVTKIGLGDSLATCARFVDGSLFVGFQGSRTVKRYSVVNGGEKLHATQEAQLDGLPRAFDVADVDGDGTAELLVAGGDERVWTFEIARELPLGEMTPLAPRATLKTSEVPIDLEHGELDGAPPIEIVAIGLHGQDAHVLAPSGASTSTSTSMSTSAAERRVYAGQHPLDSALGDVDGDGRLDLAVANVDAKRVSVLFGTGDARRFTSVERAPVGRSPHSLAIADLDRDGALDVVALTALDARLSTLLSRGGALAPGQVQAPAPAADAVRCADVDGDGNVDALCLERIESGTQLVAFFGDGTGRLAARALVEPVRTGTSAGELLVVDLDGDGALEAVASDPEGNRVAIVSIERGGEGGARFSAARSIEVPAGPKALAALQAQADAPLEIAVALAGPGTRLGVAFLRVARDDGGALVLAEYAHVPLEDPAISIATGDFDADTLPDLAILCQRRESDAFVRVGLQTKDRAWRPLPVLPTGLRPYAIRAGDLDGDGRADLVVSAQNSHHVECWLARAGDPPAFARTPDLGAGTGCLDVQLADLDGDGKLEIVVANAFSDDVTTIRAR